ncbi:T-lymphocyte surface antigen Ly-9-like isoform X3 [Elephas maximus indicus]|uniref:T-lymphocyte surface antigen Ly-9-like isoform X3 n=1 Tax=Elephas maximus indicus TaxID=99487 RepID=UPI002116A607|nr:T-lymphocyte surface antigen Ly-9-like isoform X3 [Elephas maximus indicus]
MADPKRYTDDCVLGPFLVKPQKSQSQVFSSALWTPLLFLLVGLRASGEDSVPIEVAGTLEGFVTFPLTITVDTEIEHVVWTGPQNAIALAHPGGITILDRSYQSRLNISSKSYSMQLSKLTLRDAGHYRAQINTKNSNSTTEKTFILHVYEQLQEPRVTVEHTVSESTSCNLTLVCSMERERKGVLYSWTVVGTHASESFEGSTLTISWMPCDPDVAYTCIAKNPVSQISSHPVHVPQFCADPGASRGGTMGETVVGMLGESVTLPLVVLTSQDIEKVVWMFNTSIISKERGEAATAGPLIKSKEPGKDRVRVSSQDYALKISQLKMEDAGPYNAYMCSGARRVMSTKHFTLHVYRRLKKPEITWSSGPPEDSICRVTLMCSVEDSGDDVTYRWTFLQKGAVVAQGGSLLNVSWSGSEYYPSFTCTATNPVSNSSRQLFPGNICPGSAPALSDSQVEVPAETSEPTVSHNLFTMLSQGYKKLDPFPKTARQWPRTTSDNSFDSSLTTEEDKERTEMQEVVSGRDAIHDLTVQEDMASKGQAEYDLITPSNVVPDPVVEGNTVYTQVFFRSREKAPVLQKKDSSNTVYCSIQKSQLPRPPPQQNDEFPEISTYENFS